MIRGEVKQQADIGTEISGCFQLKTGQLQHHNFRFSWIQQIFQNRGADIAADKNLLARAAQEMTDQAGYGGFAVGPGHRDDRHSDPASGEGKLSNNRHAPSSGRSQHRQIHRHTGTGHNQIRIDKKGSRMAACLQLSAEIYAALHKHGLLFLRDRLPKLRNRDIQSLLVQIFHRRQPGFSQADHNDFHARLQFNHNLSTEIICISGKLSAFALLKRTYILRRSSVFVTGRLFLLYCLLLSTNFFIFSRRILFYNLLLCCNFFHLSRFVLVYSL
ncbi:hypothetical protein VT98_10054 [Candidatus Electrothrix communis]|uniref:Uncharacterized protein n=1 Tax=Candidatus Electrothrix communis TaxID=1859133 RepID=A0A3S3R4B2_9BACT|nr:hypothetical protein VT98_10054 [Candidatus Electrothrix communis]